jgi:hypothetical protein
MRILIRTSLLALLASPLCAQFSASGGLILPLDSLKKATHGDLAYLAGADFNGRLSGTEVPARLGLSLARMPGKEENGLTTSLTLAQLHGDVFIATGAPRLRALAGLSLNNYTMSRRGTENTDDPLDKEHHFPVRDVKGLKLGLRLGVDFALAGATSLELIYQQTELAGKDLQDPYVRQGGINPGWIQLLVTYHF